MTPFVVLGMPRTGSTLLSTGLSQHPGVRCYNELFHPVDTERQRTHALVVNGARVYFQPHEDAIGFLRTNVFSQSNSTFTAVGFKLFGDYVRGPGAKDLFLRLRGEIPDLRVIHIARTNYLDVLVSLEIARETSQWVIFKAGLEARKEVERISIDPTSALGFFDHMHQMDCFYEEFFPSNRYCKILYEKLDSAYQEAMDAAYSFLHLRPFWVKPITVKQRVRSIRELIVNYDKLAEAFAGTPYANFFHHDGL